MVTEISAATRTEVLGAIRNRYRKASKRDKSRMLDEFVALTGCHRKHAVRLLGLSPNPPMDGVRTAEGGGGAAGEMAWAPLG